MKINGLLQVFDIDGTFIVAPNLLNALEAYIQHYGHYCNINYAKAVETYVNAVSDMCKPDSLSNRLVSCNVFLVNGAVVCAKDMLDAVKSYVPESCYEELSEVNQMKTHTGDDIAFMSKDCFIEE